MTESDGAAAAGADFVPGFGDIGARLRSARERAGLSVAQVSEKMHCDRSLVEALDAGRFAQLGAAVFARGHIRRYAELLGEPVGEILERWDREAAGHVAPPDLTRIPTAKRGRDPRRVLLPVGVAGLVAAFAVLIFWVLRDSPPPAAVSVPVATQASPPLASDAVAVDPATADTAEAALSTASPPASVAAQSAAPATAAPAPATAAATVVALRLRARNDCWVEIYDLNRKQLFFGMVRGGAATSVSAAGPLRVLLGNVGGIAIDVNGRTVSVPRALQRANTANVRVAADGTFSAIARD